jgi:hypothetical protein
MIHRDLDLALRGALGDDGDEFQIPAAAVEGGVDGACRDEDGGTGAERLLLLLQSLLGLALDDVDDLLLVRVHVERMASARRHGAMDDKEIFGGRKAGSRVPDVVAAVGGIARGGFCVGEHGEKWKVPSEQ